MADTSTISPSPVSSTASSLAKLKTSRGASASILGGAGYSILNAGGSLLDAGRRINRSGIGMSANSRAALEGFFNNASAIFNQLYTKAENSEVTNQMQILALRSKYAYLAVGGPFDENRNVSASENGTNVDTSA